MKLNGYANLLCYFIFYLVTIFDRNIPSKRLKSDTIFLLNGYRDMPCFTGLYIMNCAEFSLVRSADDGAFIAVI